MTMKREAVETRKTIETYPAQSKKMTKLGMASMYLVVFVTMLTGIITLSFTRIMMTDSKESSAADLSQSAYDAAQAGIEEAKLAILYYHDCVSKGYAKGVDDSYSVHASPSGEKENCENAIHYMTEGANKGDCNVAAKVLGRIKGDNARNQETLLRTQYSGTGDNDTFSDQAYTCVQITEELDDYKTSLSQMDSYRVIPIRTKEYDEVKSIILDYETNDLTSDGETIEDDNKTEYLDLEPELTENGDRLLPILSFEIFQTTSDIKMNELDSSKHSMVLLYSSSSSGSSNTQTPPDNILSKNTFTNLAKRDSQNVLNYNPNRNALAQKVDCAVETTSSKGRCKIQINLPELSNRAESSFFLRVALPYKGPGIEEMSITLCKKENTGTSISCEGTVSGTTSNETTKFVGVQAEIDSTGRAGTFFRRVKARVELVDVNFTYPEYAIEATGEGGINKNFWVTDNKCWYADNGNSHDCTATAGDYDGKF